MEYVGNGTVERKTTYKNGSSSTDKFDEFGRMMTLWVDGECTEENMFNVMYIKCPSVNDSIIVKDPNPFYISTLVQFELFSNGSFSVLL